MSSILVVGSSFSHRKSEIEKYITKDFKLEISENNPDLIFIESEEGKKSIGIGQVKNLLAFISEKPMSHKLKAIVILKAEMLTDQAQNSLLKVLEEHPSYFHFVLGARTEKDLLETVISRCKRVNLAQVKDFLEDHDGEEGINSESKTSKSKANSSTNNDIKQVINQKIGDRLVWALKQSENERSEVIEMLEKMVSTLRKSLNVENVKRIELILKVKKDLEDTNVTLKLALEYLAVKL